MPNDLSTEFNEYVTTLIQDLSLSSTHSPFEATFTYCDADIDTLSDYLGIPWEPSKTIPFSFSVPYLGFDWDLATLTVSLMSNKKTKYKAAITQWLSKTTHNLDEVQQLDGKLLHASTIIPTGQAYLTSLETMLASFTDNPFMPHHPPHKTSHDLR